jgi:hypothetical protein
MTDKVLAAMALGGLAAFCGVVVWFVPDVDLTIVMVGVLVLAVVDFYRTIFHRNSDRE